MLLRLSLVIFTLGATLAVASEWTGYVTDSFCGAANANDAKWSKECSLICVKQRGAKPVLVVGEETVYQFSNSAKAMDFVGEKVKVTGKLDKEILTIETIRKAPNPMAKK